MSNRPAFDPKELEVAYMKPCGLWGMFDNMGIPAAKDEPIYNYPISSAENIKLAISGEKPYWIPHVGMAYCETNPFRPRQLPDNVAVRLVSDGGPNMEYPELTAKGWFDLEWVYVPVAGGATVKPGNPKLEDMNDWEKVLEWPDLDAIDWEEIGRMNKEYLSHPQLNQFAQLDGFWERLISLMDVEGAAIAMVDEDQKDALKAFFDRYADFLVEIIERLAKVCKLDSMLIHDDWGHQNGSFFSLDTCMEMIVPYAKRVTDAAHAHGWVFEIHSCGKNQGLVPAYIAAGADFWCPQAINDVDYILETYKDSHFFLGMPTSPVAPNAPEDEARAAARTWFEKYKDLNVFISFMGSNPYFMEEIYKISREEYSKY